MDLTCGAGDRWHLRIVALTLIIAFAIFIGWNLVIYFILFALPGLVTIFIAVYFKRPLGALSIALLALILNFLISYYLLQYSMQLSALVYVILILLVFTTLLFSSIIWLRSKKYPRKRRSMAVLVGVNAVLFAFYIISFFTFVHLYGVSYNIAVSLNFYPFILAIIFSVIYGALAYILRKRNIFLLGENHLNIALSLFAWGFVAGFPTLFATTGVSAGCTSTVVSLSYGLYLFTLLTLVTGAPLLTGHFVCEKFCFLSTNRVKEGKFSFILIILAFILLLIASLISLGISTYPSFLLTSYLIFVIFPVFLSFISLYYFRRYWGALIISSILLLMEGLWAQSILSLWPCSQQCILYFIIVISALILLIPTAAMQIENISQTPSLRNERLYSLIMNIALFFLFYSSFLPPYRYLCSVPPVFFVIIPWIVSAILSSSYILALYFTKKCKMAVLSSNLINLSLSMIGWGLFGVITYWMLAQIWVAYSCSCSIPMYPGLFVFMTATISTATALLSGHLVCGVSCKK